MISKWSSVQKIKAAWNKGDRGSSISCLAEIYQENFPLWLWLFTDPCLPDIRMNPLCLRRPYNSHHLRTAQAQPPEQSPLEISIAVKKTRHQNSNLLTELLPSNGSKGTVARFHRVSEIWSTPKISYMELENSNFQKLNLLITSKGFMFRFRCREPIRTRVGFSPPSQTDPKHMRKRQKIGSSLEGVTIKTIRNPI